MSVLAALAVSPCQFMKASSCCSTGVKVVACSFPDPKTRAFSCSTKKSHFFNSSSNLKLSTFLPNTLSTLGILQLILLGALNQKAKA